MRHPFICFVLLTSAIYLWGVPVVAQDAAPEPEAISVWVPFSDTRVFNARRDWESQTLSDGSKLEVGDPAVGRWAERITSKASRLKPKDLGIWLKLVGHYRVVKAKPMLIKAADRLIKREAQAGDNRNAVFRALAQTAEKRDATALKRLLKAPVVGQPPNPDAAFLVLKREWFAASLLNLGDPAGRDYLFNEYQKHMLLKHTKKQYYHSNIVYILDTVYDPELVKQINGLIDHADLKGNGSARNEIKKLVGLMKVNGLPLDKLREIVRGPHKIGDEMQLQALHALAERGTADDLKLIEGIYGEYEQGTRKGSYTKKQFQLAAVAMRCRLWKKLKR